MSDLIYFAEWATPKKWAKKRTDVNSLPTHLSAFATERIPGPLRLGAYVFSYLLMDVIVTVPWDVVLQGNPSCGRFFIENT